jgi:hypothetical protein
LTTSLSFKGNFFPIDVKEADVFIVEAIAIKQQVFITDHSITRLGLREKLSQLMSKNTNTEGTLTHSYYNKRRERPT